MPRQIKVVPECVYGNKSTMVCVNSQCRKPGFLCEKGLANHNQCALFHDQCSKMDWNQMEQLIHDNPNIKSPQFAHLQEKIQEIFGNLANKLQNQHLKFRIWVRTFGYTSEVMNFIDLINKGQHSTISGHVVNSLMTEVFMKEKQIDVPAIDPNEIQDISIQSNNLFSSINHLYHHSNDSLKTAPSSDQSHKSINTNILFAKSRITNDSAYIQSLFDQIRIKSATLLYRASQNNFSANTFHKQCDQIPNTLTLIETQFGKIIGGFTPLTWNSSKKHWAADKQSKTFIFSVSSRQKYSLNLPQFAIACNNEKGPIFGCCDICIVDNAHIQKSNAEFPISFNNYKYTRSPNASTAFTGNAKGRFLTKEWEVWKLEFY